MAKLGRHKAFFRVCSLFLIAGFLITADAGKAYSTTDALRQRDALHRTDSQRDGGLMQDLNADLHARAKAKLAGLSNRGTQTVYEYDKKIGAYTSKPYRQKEA